MRKIVKREKNFPAMKSFQMPTSSNRFLKKKKKSSNFSSRDNPSLKKNIFYMKN